MNKRKKPSTWIKMLKFNNKSQEVGLLWQILVNPNKIPKTNSRTISLSINKTLLEQLLSSELHCQSEVEWKPLSLSQETDRQVNDHLTTRATNNNPLNYQIRSQDSLITRVTSMLTRTKRRTNIRMSKSTLRRTKLNKISQLINQTRSKDNRFRNQWTKVHFSNRIMHFQTGTIIKDNKWITNLNKCKTIKSTTPSVCLKSLLRWRQWVLMEVIPERELCLLEKVGHLQMINRCLKVSLIQIIWCFWFRTRNWPRQDKTEIYCHPYLTRLPGKWNCELRWHGRTCFGRNYFWSFVAFERPCRIWKHLRFWVDRLHWNILLD